MALHDSTQPIATCSATSCVDQDGRELFFKRNPSVAEHWINDTLNKDTSIQNIRKSR
ncbi:MAG: hypothetical protein GY702_22830 [Desulfobulbaceae bacterium]|nr:hypothetical protein [Desulfobulbaceae bacterium]